ncbi:hypothetical protein [Planococcus sp. CAU13]|uniref:hypothetical protein n=1 Tax=Planococcus sp. CAU13 TaxID=1541197 RepID=UPI00052FE1BA|nr:hypothetical protein [Planococcus sp. CAU13]
MHTHIVYYRSVHFLFIIITFLIFPLFATSLLFFYNTHLIYQFLSIEKILVLYPLFIVSTFFSGKLYALRKERGPTRWNQFLFIGLLTIFIILPTTIGYSITKNYGEILKDDIPVQMEGSITHLATINEKYLGVFGHGFYGQLPSNSPEKINRYAIEFKVNQQAFQTAYFASRSEYIKTINRMKELKNQPVIITYLPNTKQIMRIEENVVLPGEPLYENHIFFSKKQ